MKIGESKIRSDKNIFEGGGEQIEFERIGHQVNSSENVNLSTLMRIRVFRKYDVLFPSALIRHFVNASNFPPINQSIKKENIIQNET